MNTVCIAKTKKGTQCKNKPQCCNYCYLHKKNNNNIVLPGETTTLAVNDVTYNKTFIPYIIIPDDIIKEILRYVDIYTIINYCSCCKNNIIKNDNNFWLFIFNRDNIKLYEQTNNLYNQYIYTTQCIKEASQILTLIDIENIKYVYILNNLPSIPLYMIINNIYIYFSVSKELLHNISLINNELTKEILTEILYFNPDINIATHGNLKLR
jgi:hypothetical protein